MSVVCRRHAPTDCQGAALVVVAAEDARGVAGGGGGAGRGGGGAGAEVQLGLLQHAGARLQGGELAAGRQHRGHRHRDVQLGPQVPPAGAALPDTPRL